MSKRVTQSYTPGFRAEAIKLVLEQEMTAAEAAARLNMNQGTLAYWVTQARKGKKADVSTAGQPSEESLTAEVRQLRKELAEARMERDILKSSGVLCQGVALGATLSRSPAAVSAPNTTP